MRDTTVVHNLHDDYDVYIGREVPDHGIPASKWGNPFVMADDSDAERSRAIVAFREWIVTQPELMGSLEELRGQRLGCWCAPKACHGDVLVELLATPSLNKTSADKAFATPITHEGSTRTGPPRQPAQMLAEQTHEGQPSVHDGEVAATLGLPGAPIEGPTHFSQVDPLGYAAWGERWFETGCISSHFRTMVVEGESVTASLTDSGGGSAEISAVKGDGTPVLEGTATIDPRAPTALRTRLAKMQATDPGDLYIIDRLQVGDRVVNERQMIDMDTPNGAGYPFSLREKLDRITEPSHWYDSDDNPWGRPVVPFEMYSVLTNKGAGVPGARGPSNGLFVDLEVRAVAGPLFVGQAYRIETEVLCLGQSRRVESYWTESRILAADTGSHVATVLLHQGRFKASFAGYPD